jgi:hypothetical protein
MSPYLLKNGLFAIKVAFSSLDIRKYSIKLDSVVCPVIFIIDWAGIPSRYILVAALLRAV